MVRSTMLAVQLVMAGMFALAFLSGPLRTPGFNLAARAAVPPSAGGPATAPGASPLTREEGWRVGGLHTVYDDQAYALALAWLWLAEARDGSEAQRRDAARTAGIHAQRALRNGPANGFAWVALAWARHLDGDDAGARAAIDQSWAWAPRSRSLAFTRSALESRYWPELTAFERLRLLGDVLRAPSSDPEGFAKLVEDDARMATLHRLALQLGRERVGASARPPTEGAESPR